MNDNRPSVLIVEDSPDDLFMLQRAFRLAGTPNRLRHVENGQHAIDYLVGLPPFDDRGAHPLPALILLDLKLPVKHGLEVLAWIRDQASCHGLVVVVLTSSSEDRDVVRAYDLGANAFLVKPTSTEKLTEIVRALDVFWLQHNRYRQPLVV